MKRIALPLEYIAYSGKQFTIEWYYDKHHYSQPLDYAEALDDEDKAKLFKLLATLAEVGEIQNTEKFRYEGDKIFAFKPKPHRVMSFFYAGGKVILTNAFVKKKDKLPANEKTRALKCKLDYEQRVAAGTYYVKKR